MTLCEQCKNKKFLPWSGPCLVCKDPYTGKPVGKRYEPVSAKEIKPSPPSAWEKKWNRWAAQQKG